MQEVSPDGVAEYNEAPEPRTRPVGVTLIAVLAMAFGFVSFCYMPISLRCFF